jgi:hypothetical protein
MAKRGSKVGTRHKRIFGVTIPTVLLRAGGAKIAGPGMTLGNLMTRLEKKLVTSQRLEKLKKMPPNSGTQEYLAIRRLVSKLLRPRPTASWAR